MPSVIQHKLADPATSGRVPTTGQLALGELAINPTDGQVFTKRSNGGDSVVRVGTPIHADQVPVLAAAPGWQLISTTPFVSKSSQINVTGLDGWRDLMLVGVGFSNATNTGALQFRAGGSGGLITTGNAYVVGNGVGNQFDLADGGPSRSFSIIIHEWGNDAAIKPCTMGSSVVISSGWPVCISSATAMTQMRLFNAGAQLTAGTVYAYGRR